MPVADDVERHLGNHRIGQNQRMHVDEGAQFGWRILRQVAPDGLQFLVHGSDRVLQPQHLRFNLLFVDQVMLNVQRSRREQMRAPDRDAARNRNTV